MLRLTLQGMLFFALLAHALDADAARRGIRIDGFGSWDEFAIGSPGCPGTTPGETTLVWNSFMFSGRDDDAHLFDTYCQEPAPGTLNSGDFSYPDETGLVELIGANPDDAITALRYSFLDRPRFDFKEPATGFQWTFYFFPTGVTLVGLYGLDEVWLDHRSYISDGWTMIWDGTGNNYDGEYFCFDGDRFVGTWDGNLQGSDAACLNVLQRVFRDGFEP